MKNLLFADEKLVVVIGQGNRRERPGTFEARAKQGETSSLVSQNAIYQYELKREPVRVATSESVSTRESDDFLVVKAHTVEDLMNPT